MAWRAGAVLRRRWRFRFSLCPSKARGLAMPSQSLRQRLLSGAKSGSASATSSDRKLRPAHMPGAVILSSSTAIPSISNASACGTSQSGRPMTADTIFRLYSMSKPITSVAAMMLVEEGKLALDDPVAKYIPAFAAVKVGVEKTDESGKPVLALEPLNVRSRSKICCGTPPVSPMASMAVARYAKLYANAGLFDGDFDNAEFVERLAKLPLAEQPGTRMGLRPFDRCARPRRRGHIGADASISSKEAAARPARDDETPLFSSPMRRKWPRIAEPMPGRRIMTLR